MFDKLGQEKLGRHERFLTRLEVLAVTMLAIGSLAAIHCLLGDAGRPPGAAEEPILACVMHLLGHTMTAVVVICRVRSRC